MYNNTPFGSRPMPDYLQPQAIHSLQPQAMCYFVKDMTELNRAPLNPGITYVGINLQKDEIYTRQMTTNGLVDLKRYSLAEQEAPAVTPELKGIIDRIDALDSKLSKLLPQEGA